MQCAYDFHRTVSTRITREHFLLSDENMLPLGKRTMNRYSDPKEVFLIASKTCWWLLQTPWCTIAQYTMHMHIFRIKNKFYMKTTRIFISRDLHVVEVANSIDNKFIFYFINHIYYTICEFVFITYIDIYICTCTYFQDSGNSSSLFPKNCWYSWWIKSGLHLGDKDLHQIFVSNTKLFYLPTSSPFWLDIWMIQM